MDPVERWVSACVEARGLEHGDAAVGGGDVGVEGVVDVLGWVDIGDWGFCGGRVGGNFDSVAEAVPVCALMTREMLENVESRYSTSRKSGAVLDDLGNEAYHDNHTLDTMFKGFVAALLPVCG